MESIGSFSSSFLLGFTVRDPGKDLIVKTFQSPKLSIYPRLPNPHPASVTMGLGTVLLGWGFSRTILSCHCFLQSLCIISMPLPKCSHTARMLKGWKFCMKPNPSKEITAKSLCTTLQTSIISETVCSSCNFCEAQCSILKMLEHIQNITQTAYFISISNIPFFYHLSFACRI